jgi:hypothetical protein
VQQKPFSEVEDKESEEDDRDPIRKERREHLERLEKACAGTTKSARTYYELIGK